MCLRTASRYEQESVHNECARGRDGRLCRIVSVWGAGSGFDDPESVVEAYLNRFPPTVEVSTDEWVEEAQAWFHSQSTRLDEIDLEEIRAVFQIPAEDLEPRIQEIGTPIRDLSAAQLRGAELTTPVAGSITDFADQPTAVVDVLIALTGEDAAAPGAGFANEFRYLTATEDGEWQILTSVATE